MKLTNFTSNYSTLPYIVNEIFHNEQKTNNLMRITPLRGRKMQKKTAPPRRLK